MGVKKSTIVKAANGPLTPSKGLKMGKGNKSSAGAKGKKGSLGGVHPVKGFC